MNEATKLERRMKRQLAPIKRELAKAAHDRLLKKAREFVENRQEIRAAVKSGIERRTVHVKSVLP